ncbi:hypothetical protein MKW94_021685 [Papaver nudicaule]|uniref:ALOG domain-containing protein n=1 Tax=Papaver nudicaule TaxID=74823 RepID=A0AA42AX82_PAPNU|nr:hypothetical protein [Papaver nudicaule]
MASTSGGGGGGGSEQKSSDQVPRGGGGSSEVAVATGSVAPPSRYESQKRRDWNTFLQYLKNHKPPLSLARCSGAHVIEFLKYLDQFGKTKVHLNGCTYFGHPNPPAPCACPLKQAWGSLDALIGRLRAAYEENGGRPESNPFGARAVRIYLREVREGQAKARGIPYEKKKRKRPTSATNNTTTTAPTTVLPNATTSTVAVATAQVVIDGDQGGGGGDEVVTVAQTAPISTTTS